MDNTRFKNLQRALAGLPQGPVVIPSPTASSPVIEEQEESLLTTPELQLKEEDIKMGGYEQPQEIDEETKKKVLQRLIEKQNQKLNFVPGE